jgi:hypothetical protein
MVNDNEEYVRLFKVALNSVGINVNLCTADLMCLVISKLANSNDDGSDLDLKDMIELQIEHEDYWNNKELYEQSKKIKENERRK